MIIQKSSLAGELTIPPSKSQTMRALIFALLAQGKSTIFKPLLSPDTQAMVRACQLLGANVDCFGDRIVVQGNLLPAEDVIDAGNSGQVLRFIGAIAGLLPTYTVLTGDFSIRHRRIVTPLLEGLEQLGASAIAARGDGHAPMIIRGPLKGGIAEVSGQDSQPISGLLIASAFAQGNTEIFVKNPGEKPWIDLTLSWFKKFGIPYENRNFEHYKLLGRSEIYGFEYTVPGDWSSALYPIGAALMTNSELTLHGIDFDDPQGDKGVILLLAKMGAKIAVDPRAKSVTVYKGTSLKGSEINIGEFIDAITLLPVLACHADGPTRIFGGEIARAKECDRIASIVIELKKMGAKIQETADGMVIEPSSLKGAKVESYEDHRMALALSVAALAAEGKTEITGAEAISKSFPAYFEALRSLGAQIKKF